MSKKKEINSVFSQFLFERILLIQTKNGILSDLDKRKAEVANLEAALAQIDQKIEASNRIVEIAKNSGLIGSAENFDAAAPAAKTGERVNRIKKWEATLTPDERLALKTQREASLVKARAKKAENDRIRKQAEAQKRATAKENRVAALEKARAALAEKRKRDAEAAAANRVEEPKRTTLDDLIAMMKNRDKRDRG